MSDDRKNILDDLNSPDVMTLQDTDKYVRQVGSKALLATDLSEVSDYEAKRKVLLAQRNKMETLENRMGSLEQKFDQVLELLLSMKRGDTNGN